VTHRVRRESHAIFDPYTMRLPNFLVIGAMKCGTTTFYHDLAAHPRIFLAEKELGALTRDISMNEYASHFARAKINQRCGDVSTMYSMLPDVPGVVQRTTRHLPPNTKIIYLVREPVQRAISHHYHYHSLRTDQQMGADIDACVRKYPSLTNYGKYGEQLTPWIQCWGEGAVHVVQFEEYVADRAATMTRVFQFLGLCPLPHLLQSDAVQNASLGKPVLNSFWRRVTRQGLYRKFVRPCMSSSTRDRIRTAVLPTAPPPPRPPRPDTIDRLLSAFIPDSEHLRQLVNRSTPFWDYAAVGTAHVERYHRFHAPSGPRRSA
jgi:hypothetical protein